MSRLDATIGTVTSPRAGSAIVWLGDRHVQARNALNVRCPPGSTVILARDPQRGTWTIIGRER